MELKKHKIEEFILLFDDVLLEEHRDELFRHAAFLTPYCNMPKKISIYGMHYTSCPWSSSNTQSGPDTCECCDVERIKTKAEKLMHFYYRIVNKVCRDCIFKKCFIK